MADVMFAPPTEHIGVPARERLRYVARVARTYAGRLTAVMFLLVFAGLAEGFELRSCFPLSLF